MGKGRLVSCIHCATTCLHGDPGTGGVPLTPSPVSVLPSPSSPLWSMLLVDDGAAILSTTALFPRGLGSTLTTFPEESWASAALRSERLRLVTGEGGGLGPELAPLSLHWEVALPGCELPPGGCSSGAGGPQEKVCPAMHSHTRLPGAPLSPGEGVFILGIKLHSWL